MGVLHWEGVGRVLGRRWEGFGKALGGRWRVTGGEGWVWESDL